MRKRVLPSKSIIEIVNHVLNTHYSIHYYHTKIIIAPYHNHTLINYCQHTFRANISNV